MSTAITAPARRRPLLAALVVDGIGSGMFLPFAVLYFLHTTTIALPALGVCLTAANLLALAVPLGVGPMIDRFGPRLLVVAGNLLSGTAFLTYLLVDRPWQVVTAAFVAAAGQTTSWTALVGLIGAVSAPADRPRWFARQSVVRNAGYGLGGIAGAIVVGLGSALAYPLLAVVNAVSFLGVAVTIGRWRAPALATTETQRPAEPARYLDVLRNKRLLLLNGTNVLLVVCMSTLSILMTLYLVDVLGQPAWVGGVVFTLNTVLVLLAQALVTKYSNGLPRPRVVQAAAASWALAFVCLWLLNAAPTWLVLPGASVAVCAMTMAEMLYAPTINALAVDEAPAHAPGRHLAVYQLSWGIGTAMAPGLLVWLLSRGGQLPWPVLILSCAAAALCIGRLIDRGRAGERQTPPTTEEVT